MSTILVVDDDPVFLDAVDQMLSRAGYHVLRARTGREAIEELEKHHAEIHLTLVDLALPDINGFELIGAITRRASDVKVLVTTNVYKDIHLEMAGSLGAHAAMRKPPAGKPFPEREWLETVQQLIGSDERNRKARTQGTGGTPGIPNAK